MPVAWNHFTPLASLDSDGAPFGIGRGIAGFWPGLARVALASGSGAALLFSAADGGRHAASRQRLGAPAA